MNIYNHSFKYIFILIISTFFSCSSDDDTTILSSKKELLQFSILSQTTGTIDQDKKTIIITVPFGTDITSIKPTVAISENATYAPSGAQNFSSPVIYTVTAEDSTQIKYTINIIIADNTEASLLNFIFKGEDNALENDIEASIDQENLTVTAEVPFDTDLTSLIASITTSENATTNLDELDFSSEATLTVIAQDGETTVNYTIIIVNTNNTEASLSSFIFKSEDNAFEEDIEASIDQENLTITAEVPFDTNLASLIASISTSENATTNLDELDFSSEATLTVIAQDGETTVNYTINIVNANNTEASLSSFIFKSEDNAFEEDIEASIDQENLTVTAEVPFETDLTSLVASITTSENATTNLDELDFSSEATLTVIAQDGETTVNYTINIIEGTDPRNIERAVLIDIHNANEYNLLAWPIDDNTSNIADWDGVTVNEQGLIIKLDIGYEAISLLPESIINLTELTELYLYTNPSLSTLPQNIGSLSKLEILHINDTGLTSLPESIGNLSALKEIKANQSGLESLPESIGGLEQLEVLNLSRNNIETLPESIGNLSALKTLDLISNKLTSLPESIGNLKELLILNLPLNNLQSIPENIGNLTELLTFKLSGNRLQNIPESIGNLTKLTELTLNSNDLINLPESIGNLTKLTSLNLSFNEFVTLPESIGNLVLIELLNLNYNDLQSLPESIGNLVKLTSLDLETNKLENLPESIGNLTALTELLLRANSLISVPESIGNLTKLTALELGYNDLKSLPESIGNLTEVTEIFLYNSELKNLPESIGNLTKVTRLWVHNNKLESLPESIVNLSQLRDFRLALNPLLSLTTEQCSFVTAISSYSLDEGICD